jgi:hypothetical protein
MDIINDTASGQKMYSESTNWGPPSDLVLNATADGEIYTGSYVQQ